MILSGKKFTEKETNIQGVFSTVSFKMKTESFCTLKGFLNRKITIQPTYDAHNLSESDFFELAVII